MKLSTGKVVTEGKELKEIAAIHGGTVQKGPKRNGLLMRMNRSELMEIEATS